MQRCLELAKLGGRQVMPNPMVGCVIVQDGLIIAEGHHSYFGGPHAEIAALRSLPDSAELSGATLYVSLEPCAHFGKTPPCVDAIIRSGIRNVVVGCRDPFAYVAGKGIDKLRQAGISVTEPVLEDQCLLLNRRFIVAHRLGRPYVILKWATTADGFIARSDLSSKWISSEESRKLVHVWRGEEMAVLVGTTTACVDNPVLTARIPNAVNPRRVVIDRQLALPRSHNLFDSQASTIVYNQLLDESVGNVDFVKVDLSGSLQPILSDLYSKGIISLLVEGGTKLLQSFVDQEQWDEIRKFTSPKTFESGVCAPVITAPLVSESVIAEDVLQVAHHPELDRRIGIGS